MTPCHVASDAENSGVLDSAVKRTGREDLQNAFKEHGHLGRGVAIVMDYTVVAALLGLLCKSASCESLKVSQQAVHWNEAHSKCKTEKRENCPSARDIENWARSGLPDGVQLDSTVWVEAKWLDRLMWVANPVKPDSGIDIFQYSGCFQRNVPNIYQPHRAYGPYKCYVQCNHTHAGAVDFHLQDGDCYCIPKGLGKGQQVDDGQCSTICRDSWHMCGHREKGLYSVYSIPRHVRFGETRFGENCFSGIALMDSGRFDVAGSSCGLSHFAVCDGGNDFSKGPAGDFGKVEIYCRSKNQYLPSLIPQSEGDSSNLQQMWRLTRSPGLLGQWFYVNITRQGSFFWMDGTRFQADVSRNDCIAIEPSELKGVQFRTFPCSQQLRYLCLCDSSQTDPTAESGDRGEHEPASNEQVLAIAAGVGGLVVLAIFIIIAVVLYLLKKSGKLRTGKSSKIHSTSRSGEWDQADRMSRTWDHSRGVSVDEVETSTTSNETRASRHVVYENTKNLRPNIDENAQNRPQMPATTSAFSSAQNDLYTVSNRGKGENSNAATQPTARVVGNSVYSEPEAVCGPYAEVEFGEGDQCAVPKADGVDYAEIQSKERSKTTGGNSSTAAAKPPQKADATARPIGGSEVDRFSGPMGDLYTEVRKEAGVVAIVSEPVKWEDNDAGQNEVPSGICGPLGDIYAEVHK